VRDGLFAAANESVALGNLGFTDIRDVAPGEMAVVEAGRLRFERFARPRRHAHCFFEWVYFSNVGSTIASSSVYVSRARAGRCLAERETETLDAGCIVVPVPDTAKAAADAFAYAVGVPSVEGLIRNRYVGRTFIEPATIRGQRAQSKYTPLPAVLAGKRVFLIEDSIVRATTLAGLAGLIRGRGGAREIHVRVACPPIVAPCFYGIDMSTLGELFAPRFVRRGYDGTPRQPTLARMAETLGIDSLRYLTVKDLGACLGIDGRSLCTACVTGTYPTPHGNRLLARARRNARRGRAGRTYE
jgi:amidophosphoribosyltransferase